MAAKNFEILDVTMRNIDELGMFCKKTKRNTVGYQNKLKWLNKRFKEGLKYKMLMVDEGKKERELNLEFKVITLDSPKQAQNNGVNPNGTFAVLYNGQVVTYKYEKPDKFKLMLKNFMKE